MSVLSEEKVLELIEVARQKRIKRQAMAGYRNLEWLSKILDIPPGTLKNWAYLYNVPLSKVKVQKYGHLNLSADNVVSFIVLKELIYIEGYTQEGAKRQLELRGLLDGKHFLKQ